MSQTPIATASNSNYQFIFDNALEAYKKKTKKDLLSLPLLAELRACNSPDAVLTILRGQIDQSRSASSTDGRLTNWLKPTVNVLYALWDAIGGGMSLVSIRRFGFNRPRFDIRCYAGIPTCGSDLHWGRRSSLCEYLDSAASTTKTPHSVRRSRPFLPVRMHSSTFSNGSRTFFGALRPMSKCHQQQE